MKTKPSEVRPGMRFRARSYSCLWTVLYYHRGGNWVCQEPDHSTTCHFHASEIIGGREKPPALRFWVFHKSSWVKLTLRHGRRLHTHYGGRDEEGHWWEAETYEYQDDPLDSPAVVLEWGSGGRDCDGPISRSGKLICPASKLAAVQCDGKENPGSFHDGKLICLPAWETYGRTEIRDTYAEMANY